ncbi:MAG: hypothetical protein Q7K39_00165 [Candidatus Magasanikbacteria bacterium]|nr:hypothetical protein [Candidatus Magasanikbacteria bacterium]
MSSFINSLENWLKTHHTYISTSVLALSVIATLGLISPTFLVLAQELPATTAPTVSLDSTAGTAPLPAPETGAGTATQPTLVDNVPPFSEPISPEAADHGRTEEAPQPDQPWSGEKPPESSFNNNRPPIMPGTPEQKDSRGEFRGSQPGMSGQQNFGPPNGGGRSGPGGEMDEAKMAAEQKRREAQQLKGMKQGLRGMENGLKMFKRQVDRLVKQKLGVPLEISATISKIETAIAAVKAAETLEDAQAAGLEDIMEEMQKLHEYQEILEKLSRWPQAVRQVDQQVKQLERQLRQDKILATRLTKSGFDVSDELGKFESGIHDIKARRDQASALISTSPDEAFETLESVYEKFDEVLEPDRVIKMLSNLGRFNADFKRGITQAERDIKVLKAKKLDTTVLAGYLAEAKNKGKEILALMKTRPLDADAIMIAFQELDDIRQAFDENKAELTGADEDLPWEKGPAQFNFNNLSTKGISSYVTPKAEMMGGGEKFGPSGGNFNNGGF